MTQRPPLAPTAPVLSMRGNILRGHEVSAWQRAKDATLGPGPTPPRKWSWE